MLTILLLILIMNYLYLLNIQFISMITHSTVILCAATSWSVLFTVSVLQHESNQIMWMIVMWVILKFKTNYFSLKKN